MKLHRPLYVGAVATWLPETVETATEAVSSGRLAQDDVPVTGYRQLPVSHACAPPDMAVLAAHRALAATGEDPGEVGLLVHAWTYHQGHDFWSPAHYIAHRTGALGALPVGVQQMCNGGACGLELAAARLQADPSTGTAVVTTGDRFCAPGFDRWRGDYGLWYGDAGTAAVLHSAPPKSGHALELLSLVTAASPVMETMHRGRDPFSPAPREHSDMIDIRRTKKAFLQDNGKEHFAKTVQQRVPSVIRQALHEAGVDLESGLRAVLLPRLGRTALEAAYLPAVAQVTDAPALDVGHDTGHLGAGDMLANLALLAGDGAGTGAGHELAPGETAVVLSAGGGFTWSCAVARRPRTRPTHIDTADPSGRGGR
ncbi:ketoacyl-ACP synthase III family protein [Streptomyces sp. NPDC051776]|uniref:ketoacyl-ACP synthase III family protein n=1 Tax=Streptomyces sp. NPDC051776 TaxID=3155414 RepID=UPI003422BBFC